MRPTSRLLCGKLKVPKGSMPPVRITLFTRENCSLCTDAKLVLKHVCHQRPYAFIKEVDVMSHGGVGWKDLYEFDTPVIHITQYGINRGRPQEEAPELSSKAVKLMHRFTEKEVLEKMDLVMNRELKS